MNDNVPATYNPRLRTDAIQLFALCGFAIAQPILDLVGNNPTFFVAHDLDGSDVVLVALGLLLVPPVVVFALLAIARAISQQVAGIVRAVLVGALVALTLVPPLERAIGFSTFVWAIALLVCALAAGVAYLRFSPLRTFFTYLGPAPLLFLLVFIFVSPAHTLILGSDPAALAADLEGSRTPVVMLVVDELPLGVLLDRDGNIDAQRYPGFARLAAASTWYPHATTVALATQLAVPAVASGHFPPKDGVPVAADYPQSLFTLLGATHRPEVDETVTRLCPREICKPRAKGKDTGSVSSDLKTVYLRTVLPEATADSWGVPPTTDRWASFGTGESGDFTSDATLTVDENIAALSADQPARFEAFLDSLEPGDSPGLFFEHNLLPHSPYEYLPDGRRYNGQGGFGHFVADWPDAGALVRAGGQRLVLQTMYVDHLIDRFLDRLDDTGLFGDALVVVVADHGIAFEPGTYRRTIETSASRDAVLPVPLFIKYPGQEAGSTDERDARTIDVVPTIADALGIKLPGGWDFDGRSLISDNRSRRPFRIFGDPDSDASVEVPDDIDAGRTAEYLFSFLSDTAGDHDQYRIGPFGDYVGIAADSLVEGASSGTVRADDQAAYDDVDLDGIIPALYEATLTDVPADEWIAVTIDGTIAGLGQAYQLDGQTRVAVMLDPSLLHAGANDVAVYAIGQDGALHPLTVRT